VSRWPISSEGARLNDDHAQPSDPRSDLHSAFYHLFNNRWLWASILFAIVAQVVVVEVPLLQTAFGTASLDLAHWAITVAMASVVLWAEELVKLVRRARSS